MKGYAQKVRRYFRFCEERGIVEWGKSVNIERFIFLMWGKGNSKQSPGSFRSALRKFCLVRGFDDPFDKRLSAMIEAFEVDFPALEVREVTRSEISKILGFCVKSGSEKWRDLGEFVCFTLWQNVRLSTLVELRGNDFFLDEGLVWFRKVKWHRRPILGVLHPAVEEIVRKRLARMKRSGERFCGRWKKKGIAEAFKEVCKLVGVRVRTWHNLRHSSTQRMSDLSYPQEVMRALGLWKMVSAMKVYVRRREKKVSEEEWELHQFFIEILSERLRRARGRMGWFRTPALG